LVVVAVAGAPTVAGVVASVLLLGGAREQHRLHQGASTRSRRRRRAPELVGLLSPS
jgi:hypothetical protein